MKIIRYQEKSGSIGFAEFKKNGECYKIEGDIVSVEIEGIGELSNSVVGTQ